MTITDKRVLKRFKSKQEFKGKKPSGNELRYNYARCSDVIELPQWLSKEF
jgi:hypothetical protein